MYIRTYVCMLVLMLNLKFQYCCNAAVYFYLIYACFVANSLQYSHRVLVNIDIHKYAHSCSHIFFLMVDYNIHFFLAGRHRMPLLLRGMATNQGTSGSVSLRCVISVGKEVNAQRMFPE